MPNSSCKGHTIRILVQALRMFSLYRMILYVTRSDGYPCCNKKHLSARQSCPSMRLIRARSRPDESNAAAKSTQCNALLLKSDWSIRLPCSSLTSVSSFGKACGQCLTPKLEGMSWLAMADSSSSASGEQAFSRRNGPMDVRTKRVIIASEPSAKAMSLPMDRMYVPVPQVIFSSK